MAVMKQHDVSVILFIWVLIAPIVGGCAEDVLLINQGTVFHEKGQYDKAIAQYTKAIELNADNAMAYYNRGLAYLNKGQYDKAVSDYNKVIELNPKDSEARYNRGLAYLSKGWHKAAVSDYDKALEINPSYADAYYSRGVAYFYMQEYDNSWRDVNQAQALGYSIHPIFLKKLREASGTIVSPTAVTIDDEKTRITGVASRTQKPSVETSVPAAKPAPAPQKGLQMAVAPSPEIKPSTKMENTAERTVQRENWLLSQDATCFTIQIMSHPNEAFVLSFIKKNQLLKQNEVAYYQYRLNNKIWYRLLYGIYPTKKDAQLAVDKLPGNIRKSKPWINNISKVQKAIRERSKR